MKVVILAGGFGTRISEKSVYVPKPMVEIGGKPILWHIMKIYSHYGLNEFIICCGYKGYVIKEFFANYFLHTSDITFDMKKNDMIIHKQKAEPWKVTLVDTGENTMTGGRISRIKEHLNEETFCLTYGDGLSDININKLIAFHKSSGKKATVTAVQPLARFGALVIDRSKVTSFKEKPQGDGDWINGGFFVLDKSVLEFIKNDQTTWEDEPLKELAQRRELNAFIHKGFWQPMDTLRDKNYLENLYKEGNAPWKIWN